MTFPSLQAAPPRLLAVDGGCGLLAAWGVLTYFGRRARTQDLIDSCRYTKKHGVFTIALALALHERGLRVRFHSELDPDPKRIERRCYARARAVGLLVKSRIGLADLLTAVTHSRIAVVLYNTAEGNGHFSPLLGRRGERLILPYDPDGGLGRRVFARRWSEPEILRQCIVIEDGA